MPRLRYMTGVAGLGCTPCLALADATGNPPPPSLLSQIPIDTISAIALTFHGYRRTGSIVWALLYGLAGRQIPAVAVPIALAQGFGQRKACP